MWKIFSSLILFTLSFSAIAMDDNSRSAQASEIGEFALQTLHEAGHCSVSVCKAGETFFYSRGNTVVIGIYKIKDRAIINLLLTGLIEKRYEISKKSEPFDLRVELYAQEKSKYGAFDNAEVVLKITEKSQ